MVKILFVIYILTTQLAMIFVGIPIYQAKGEGTSVSISLFSVLISLIPPLFAFIFSLINKKFLEITLPLTIGFSSIVYYLRFSFADEILIGSFLIALCFYKNNIMLEKSNQNFFNKNKYGSKIFNILILLIIYSALIGIFNFDLRIIKSLLFISVLQISWWQRKKIYGILFNFKASVYVLSGFTIAIATNILHGILQIFYNPLVFAFGSVDGALGIQGPQIGAGIPYLFIYLIVIQKKLQMNSMQLKKIDNLIFLLSTLILALALITDSRTVLLLYILPLLAYVFSRKGISIKISKQKLILSISSGSFLFFVLVSLGYQLFGDHFYFLTWIWTLIWKSLDPIINLFNQNNSELYQDFVYQGLEMQGQKGDYGRLVFLIHGIMTPLLHPITIFTGLGDYSFFNYAKDSLDKVSQFLSGEDFVNTIGYTIGDSTKLIFPKPPVLASIFLEKGLIFTLVLFEYLRLIGKSIYKYCGFLTAGICLACIFITFVVANFEDNLSLILLMSPPLLIPSRLFFQKNFQTKHLS